MCTRKVHFPPLQTVNKKNVKNHKFMPLLETAFHKNKSHVKLGNNLTFYFNNFHVQHWRKHITRYPHALSTVNKYLKGQKNWIIVMICTM